MEKNERLVSHGNYYEWNGRRVNTLTEIIPDLSTDTTMDLCQIFVDEIRAKQVSTRSACMHACMNDSTYISNHAEYIHQRRK